MSSVRKRLPHMLLNAQARKECDRDIETHQESFFSFFRLFIQW